MRTPLWLRGLRSRPLVNALLLVLATMAVATAVLGPLLVRAAHQHTVRSTVTNAERNQVSVVLGVPAQGESAQELESAYAQQSGTLESLLKVAVFRAQSSAWQPPEVFVASTSNLAWTGPGRQNPVSSRINVVADSCGLAYALSAGRCPARAGEVAVSVTDAKRSALVAGRALTLVQLESGPQRLQVVGVYDPTAADRGQLIRPGTPAGGLASVTAEPLLVTADQAAALLVPAKVTVRLSLAAGPTVDQVAGIRATLAAVDAGVGEQQQIVEVQTALPRLLDQIDTHARTAAILMAVSVVQAVALALFAVGIVLQRVARTRAAEWGIGRLRGVPRGRWLTSVYVEPGLVLLAGLPLGFALGAAVARAAVDRHLGPATPVELTRWPVVVVAALAAGGALVALLAVSARSVRRPLPELISSATEPRRLTVPGAVAQTAVLLLAAASGYQLLAGGPLGRERSLLGLLAPALFALALAVLAVRAAVLVVRGVTARPPRTLAALVVGRQTARAPSTLNPAIVLATGLALVVFAGQVLVLAERNADLRAAAIIGADQVLEVAVPPGTDLVETVRAADPSGQWAMAAQERRGPFTGGTGRIVAVDSTRLAAVSAWSPQWAEVGDLAAALRPAKAPPVELRGTTVAVTVAAAEVKATALTPGTNTPDAKATAVPPDLLITVDTGQTRETISFGPVPGAAATLRSTLPCASGCRLVSLGMASPLNTAYEAVLTVTGIGTDRQPASASTGWLREPGGWREVVGQRTSLEVENTATPEAGQDGLRVRISDDFGDRATLVAPADTDDPLPALVGPDVAVVAFPGTPDVANGVGLDGRSQLIRVVGRAAILPRSLRDGVLVDLTNAGRLVDPASNESVSQVWLRAGAPAGIESRLTKAGLRVQSRENRSETAAELKQEAVPRAAVLSVWVGGAALLLTLVTLVAGRVTEAARRRRDWAALRQAGLTAATLRRLAFAEIALPALLGAAVGLLAGVLAIRLAAPKLPLTDPSAPGPPLDLTLEWLPVGLLGLGVAAVVLVVAAVGAALETRPGRDR